MLRLQNACITTEHTAKFFIETTLGKTETKLASLGEQLRDQMWEL